MSNMYSKSNGLNSLRDTIFLKEQLDRLKKPDEEDLEHNLENENDGKLSRGRTWNDTQLAIIGQHIKNVRQLRKIPQSDLEKKLQICQGYMTYIENGKLKRIDRTLVKSIAFHLDSDFTDLLLEVDRKNVVYAEEGHAKDHFKRTRIHREEFTGDDFTVEYEVNNDNFIFRIIGADRIAVQTYKGKKIRQHPFLEAVEEAVRMIRKAI